MININFGILYYFLSKYELFVIYYEMVIKISKDIRDR